jgi:S1-C subfamily serine protease
MRWFHSHVPVPLAHTVLIALVAASCTFGLGGNSRAASGSAAGSSPRPAQVVSAQDIPPANSTTPAMQHPAVYVYQRNAASVVNITSLALVPTLRGFAQQPQGVGSGFMYDDQGRIVTNNHVVQDAAQLQVTFADGTTVPARLLGRDPDNDLAVIEVDPNATDDNGRPIRDRLKPVELGDSDRVTIGEYAIAIGSPLGLRQTVTAGIVSALRQPGEEGAAGQGELDLLGGAIQTDAPINPGNSGGPLFNAGGQVIGVNTAIVSQSGGNIGIGFAIPVNVVKRVVPELIDRGCYRHPLIGVTTVPLSQIGQAARQQLGIPPNLKGLLVQDVSAGAQRAGIRPGNRMVILAGVPLRVGGDIIVAIDGRPVSTGGELRGYIENTKRPGDTVTLTILRDGQRMDVPVTLTERPSDQPCR